jgi:hypothetical protein
VFIENARNRRMGGMNISALGEDSELFVFGLTTTHLGMHLMKTKVLGKYDEIHKFTSIFVK